MMEERGQAPPVIYRYAVLRVVPRAERQEFVNTGILLQTLGDMPRMLLEITQRWRLAQALAPEIDTEQLQGQLAGFAALARGEDSAGRLAALPVGERFHWLTAVRSGVLRCSAVHVGLTGDADQTLVRLAAATCPDP